MAEFTEGHLGKIDAKTKNVELWASTSRLIHCLDGISANGLERLVTVSQ
jgi:hypothetical protein